MWDSRSLKTYKVLILTNVNFFLKILNFWETNADIYTVRTKTRYIEMADTQFSFNRPYKPFGLNVKVPEIGEKTLKQAGETLTNIATGPVDPLFKFLEENETVFNGDITFQINKMFAQGFTIGSAMRVEDEKTNGMPPSFDMHF